MKNRDKINKALLANTYEVKMNLIKDWNNHLNIMLKWDTNLKQRI